MKYECAYVYEARTRRTKPARIFQFDSLPEPFEIALTDDTGRIKAYLKHGREMLFLSHHARMPHAYLAFARLDELPDWPQQLCDMMERYFDHENGRVSERVNPKGYAIRNNILTRMQQGITLGEEKMTALKKQLAEDQVAMAGFTWIVTHPETQEVFGFTPWDEAEAKAAEIRLETGLYDLRPQLNIDSL